MTYGGYQVSQPVAHALQLAEGIVGGSVPLTGGFRTREQQADLYRRKPGLAAPPGHSFHETGNAIDVNNDWFQGLDPKVQQAFVDTMKAQNLDWGGDWESKTEPWHFGYGETDEEN